MTPETRLMTADELAELPDAGCRYELVEGELLTMAPAGGEHGAIPMLVLRFVPTGLFDSGFFLNADTGIVLRTDPDTVRAADLAWVQKDRLHEGKLPRGYSRVVPDFVLEVVSPCDRACDVNAKVREWLQAGVRLVWVAWPEERAIWVWRSPTNVTILQADDVLDGANVLPGFQCRVAEVFPS